MTQGVPDPIRLDSIGQSGRVGSDTLQTRLDSFVSVPRPVESYSRALENIITGPHHPRTHSVS